MARRPELSDGRIGYTPSWTTLALGGLLHSGCASQSPTPAPSLGISTKPQPTATDVATLTHQPSNSADDPRRLEGWETVVWNDELHFPLALDDGQMVQLRQDEELTAPLGGPLALDRIRVSALVVAGESPHIYEVLSITREGDR